MKDVLYDFIKEQFIENAIELKNDGENPLHPMHVEDFEELMIANMRAVIEEEFCPEQILIDFVCE